MNSQKQKTICAGLCFGLCSNGLGVFDKELGKITLAFDFQEQDVKEEQ